jgi:hypothetical protein
LLPDRDEIKQSLFGQVVLDKKIFLEIDQSEQELPVTAMFLNRSG